MKGRSFIGAPRPPAPSQQVTLTIDNDPVGIMFNREGLYCVVREISVKEGRVYGVCNGFGVLLAESLKYMFLAEWQHHLSK